MSEIQEGSRVLLLSEKESLAVAMMVKALATFLREDIIGAILHETPASLLLEDGDVVALSRKLEAIFPREEHLISPRALDASVGEAKPKQVIVMRADLNMRKGKMIAQGAHAAMKCMIDRFDWLGWDGKKEIIHADLDDASMLWLQGVFAKICVRVESEEELLDVFAKAKESGLPCALIEDRGLTEFHGQLTKTCCAIGPAFPERIDPITGHLKLL